MTDYNPSIPQPTDLISNSQAQILNNFGQLNTIFGLDHYEYNNATVANRGLHKHVTFPAVQGGDPALGGVFGELYTKAVSAVTQLFYANATQVIQLTGVNSVGSNGYTTVPGGLLMQWGTFAFVGTATSLTVSFPTPFLSGIFFYTANAVTTTGVTANVLTTQTSGLTQLIITRAAGAGVVNNMSVVIFALGK